MFALLMFTVLKSDKVFVVILHKIAPLPLP